ncbi:MULTISPECIES: hypothetical protein [unclassified Leptolyngbya]|uniref:hypothetical protein n=1 Tax=unclassified Leptolyngbya TaxID=2650499 RepID=UPI0016878CFD|nr:MULTISPECIES: hypothetical protein [unclassified Leptolyngbya]MBD1912526.1 hypothetical protein [Leptolyngbya sp. FACHB-8]MBD2156463.1 hypothetical protein [Leptolyngbya sp. FACHB-16]
MDRDPLESEAIAPEEPSSRSDAARSLGIWEILGQLWRQYPLLFWSGIWTSMLVMAAIAMSGLMNPELSQPVHLKISEHPIANDDPEAPMPPVMANTGLGKPTDAAGSEKDSPLWLFLLLAASCGMGCVALSAKLQSSRTITRQRLQRLEALAQSLPTELEAPPLNTSLTTGLERFIPPVPSNGILDAEPESGAEMPSQVSASDRPSLDVPHNSRLRELDRWAPGLAELLDIQRRREGKKWEP